MARTKPRQKPALGKGGGVTGWFRCWRGCAVPSALPRAGTAAAAAARPPRAPAGQAPPIPEYFCFFFFFPSSLVLPSFPEWGVVCPSRSPSRGGTLCPALPRAGIPPKITFSRPNYYFFFFFFLFFHRGRSDPQLSPAHHCGSLLRLAVCGGLWSSSCTYLESLSPAACRELSRGEEPNSLIGSLMARGKVCACHCSSHRWADRHCRLPIPFIGSQALPLT